MGVGSENNKGEIPLLGTFPVEAKVVQEDILLL